MHEKVTSTLPQGSCLRIWDRGARPRQCCLHNWVLIPPQLQDPKNLDLLLPLSPHLPNLRETPLPSSLPSASQPLTRTGVPVPTCRDYPPSPP